LEKDILFYEKWMSRCIQIATYSEGAHKPNPEVGSVIVYQDKLIGEGWHKKYGEAHAKNMERHMLKFML